MTRVIPAYTDEQKGGIMRVQIPAYCDRWMMGDRYGEVVKTKTQPEAHRDGSYDLVQVKLDKSGKALWFPLDDCQVCQ